MSKLKSAERAQCEQLSIIHQGIIKWLNFCNTQKRQIPVPVLKEMFSSELVFFGRVLCNLACLLRTVLCSCALFFHFKVS